jgi:TP901 family phage tail tape measure protein
MVGFTIPLSIVGSAATKTFMEMEAQALKFKKVYGDLFTPQEETKLALDNITELGKQFTKYGIAVSQTVGLAAEAAAAGFQGLDLQRQTTEATRLSVLGQIDSQKALETTISLQNAFGMSSDKLADSINFLNAVENQTVVSLDDITTAIPKVAPVIQQLGGDVKDLTFFIAAMKEGGINASEGANALKSGLAALINPTGKASDMLAKFGINAKEIVVKNKGDLKATVIEFATALNELDPLNRAQAIEQMFGKFQFARLSTLFANVAKDGNQAARVLDLANSSVEELSALSEKELGMTADSAMNKFRKSLEDLKLALVPVGEAFLQAATPILEFVGGILEKFGNLSDGTKRLITVLTVGIGAVGPIFLMTFGLLANLLANTVKGAMILRQGYLRLTGQSQILGEQTQYLNTEQLEAAAAAHSLDQSHAKLTQQFTAETAALQQLIAAYQSATRAGNSFMLNNPG